MLKFYICLFGKLCGPYSRANPYLNLIWTSEYLPSEFVTLLEFKESGKTYKLYDNQESMDNLDMNWLDSDYYHFKDSNLTIHVTPIGGITRGEPFGIELKQKYNFQGFKYGMDQGQYYDDMDPNGYFDGECTDSRTFDLGLTPKQDGKNAMQLVTHAYKIIKDCEAQVILLSEYDFTSNVMMLTEGSTNLTGVMHHANQNYYSYDYTVDTFTKLSPPKEELDKCNSRFYNKINGK